MTLWATSICTSRQSHWSKLQDQINIFIGSLKKVAWSLANQKSDFVEYNKWCPCAWLISHLSGPFIRPSHTCWLDEVAAYEPAGWSIEWNVGADCLQPGVHQGICCWFLFYQNLTTPRQTIFQTIMAEICWKGMCTWYSRNPVVCDDCPAVRCHTSMRGECVETWYLRTPVVCDDCPEMRSHTSMHTWYPRTPAVCDGIWLCILLE